MIARRWWRDAVCVAIVAAVGFAIGSRYVGVFEQTAHGDFGQSEFGAAVMLACGRGFTMPAGPSPALDRFLARDTASLSCNELPPPAPGTVTFTQGLYRYLMTAVAWQWRWSGVSWRALMPLFGIAYALTLCACYGLFRQVAGPGLALAGVAPLAVSAHQLGFLPQLRDYAKAPFMLLLILIGARLVAPPLDRRRALGFAVVFGVVLGIGLGFRNDLMINIPPFIAAVCFLLPGRWREHVTLKAGCLALALVTFVVSAWPILSAYRSGSNTGHVAVLGLMSTFDTPLGVTRPVYSLGPHYLDSYGAAVINEYSRLRHGAFVEFVSPEYDAAAVSLIGDVTRHWPADIVVRGLASTRRVLQLPFTVGTLTPQVPHGLTARWATGFYQLQQTGLEMLAPIGPWAVLLAVLVAGAASPRAGIALGLLLLYYAGYPAVQFSVRHYFHLEFIAWWALVLLVARAPRVPSMTRASLRPAAVTAAVLIAVVAIPLGISRMYQQRHVAGLVDGYLQAPRTALDVSRVAVDGGMMRVEPAGLWEGHRAADPIDVRYLAFEFSRERCPVAELPMTVNYQSRNEANDFTYTTRIGISSSGPTWRLLPAYHTGYWSHFTGVTVPAADSDCLKTVARVDDLSRVPVLLDLELAPGWKNTSLFQAIRYDQ